MTVISAYRQKAQEGLIQFDPAQAEAAEYLSALEERLKNFKPNHKAFFFSKPEPAPKGVYIYGQVGRGKSMIMDLFYENTSYPHKMRIHFHEFMAKVHDDINEWRKLNEKERRAKPYYVKGAGDDPVQPVAQRIASEATLLCFDEFQITDIADAMVLGRLFDALWARQVVVVATSNRYPLELYKNGLNRALVVPFLERMLRELEVHSLDSERDYRLQRLESEPVYYSPLDDGAKAFMDRAWDRLTSGAKPVPAIVKNDGREIPIAATASGLARFEFNDICGNVGMGVGKNTSPLGTRDYLEIARIYHTILLENIPQMGPDKANEATRFRNLVDALYENKCKLIVTAAVGADDLYKSGTQSFEFERTASRLHEMRSHEYLAKDHANDSSDTQDEAITQG